MFSWHLSYRKRPEDDSFPDFLWVSGGEPGEGDEYQTITKTYAKADSDSGPHSESYAEAYAKADSYADAEADAHTDTGSYAHTDTGSYANAYSGSDAYAETERPDSGYSGRSRSAERQPWSWAEH